MLRAKVPKTIANETAGEPPSRPRMVVIELELDEAKDFSHGLADIACWGRGWMARAGDDTSHSPMGLEEVRELNIRLKRAIEKAQS